MFAGKFMRLYYLPLRAGGVVVRLALLPAMTFAARAGPSFWENGDMFVSHPLAPAAVAATYSQMNPWRLSVAPMMDWTDRHCRYFHRLLSRHALLYTEMVTTGALLHGDVARHLRFNAEEHPVALQLGGSEAADLAHCARLGEQWGYQEINLNCGCPSERVQRGAFGACLMNEPQLVADCVKAMVDVVTVPVTVKHRIGIDKHENYAFVRDFVGTVSEAGCPTFVVHARNAWLKGLSPKENREVPPLRYELVHRLKQDFPELTICINGGINTREQVAEQLRALDGVMIGREAYHNPWWLASWDADFFDASPPTEMTRETIEAQMVRYMEREAARDGTPWASIARHMLGLRHGQPGARRWRQVWSDHKLKTLPPHEVMALAQAAVREAVQRPDELLAPVF
jgi:tRNA-dihydrouridine synthase A